MSELICRMGYSIHTLQVLATLRKDTLSFSKVSSNLKRNSCALRKKTEKYKSHSHSQNSQGPDSSDYLIEVTYAVFSKRD